MVTIDAGICNAGITYTKKLPGFAGKLFEYAEYVY